VSFIFDGPVDDPAAFERTIGNDGGVEALSAAREALAATEPFDAQRVEEALRGVVEQREAKPGKIFQPVRVAIAGQTVSPGIFETVALLGKDETLARIDTALGRARGQE
jgi:glutamyl-tRNA synthetase